MTTLRGSDHTPAQPSRGVVRGSRGFNEPCSFSSAGVSVHTASSEVHLKWEHVFSHLECEEEQGLTQVRKHKQCKFKAKEISKAKEIHGF